jgi:FG-GAP repeat protein
MRYRTGQPSFTAAGDLDGDGRPDLVTANAGNNTVSVLLGRCL